MSNRSLIDGGGGGDSNVSGSSSATSPRETRKQSIERCIQSLYHASQCRDDANCRLASCIKMKRVIRHTKSCTNKKADGITPCPICKQVITLCCYHTKRCDEANCPIPYCVNIKQKVHQSQFQQRLHEVEIVQRPNGISIMASMRQSKSTSSNNAPSTSFCPQTNELYMEPAASATAQSLNEDDVAHSVEPEEGFDIELVNELLNKLELNH